MLSIPCDKTGKERNTHRLGQRGGAFNEALFQRLICTVEKHIGKQSPGHGLIACLGHQLARLLLELSWITLTDPTAIDQNQACDPVRCVQISLYHDTAPHAVANQDGWREV